MLNRTFTYRLCDSMWRFLLWIFRVQIWSKNCHPQWKVSWAPSQRVPWTADRLEIVISSNPAEMKSMWWSKTTTQSWISRVIPWISNESKEHSDRDASVLSEEVEIVVSSVSDTFYLISQVSFLSIPWIICTRILASNNKFAFTVLRYGKER